jgi:hypothetical protein
MNQEQMEAAVVDMLLAHQLKKMGVQEVYRDPKLWPSGKMRIKVVRSKGGQLDTQGVALHPDLIENRGLDGEAE